MYLDSYLLINLCFWIHIVSSFWLVVVFWLCLSVRESRLVLVISSGNDCLRFLISYLGCIYMRLCFWTHVLSLIWRICVSELLFKVFFDQFVFLKLYFELILKDSCILTLSECSWNLPCFGEFYQKWRFKASELLFRVYLYEIKFLNSYLECILKDSCVLTLFECSWNPPCFCNVFQKSLFNISELIVRVFFWTDYVSEPLFWVFYE
jgi:hypothetical protein